MKIQVIFGSRRRRCYLGYWSRWTTSLEANSPGKLPLLTNLRTGRIPSLPVLAGTEVLLQAKS